MSDAPAKYPAGYPAKYIVNGTWPASAGGATYLCATAKQALAKLRQFQREDYQNIRVTDADGRTVTEADLVRTEAGRSSADTGAPIATEALKAPVLA